MVRFLLRNKANVNANCLRGQTPICFAIAKRRYRNVEILLEAGATLHVRTVLGETPLDLARAHIEPPRADLLHRLEAHFEQESLDPNTKWINFTNNEDAIKNQCDHAWGCKNCQDNARAMARGESTIVTSMGAGGRRRNNHDEDAAAGDDDDDDDE